MATTAYAQSQGLVLLTEILETFGPIFRVEQARSIAQKVNVLQQQVSWLLSQLASSGWVVRLKRGVYMVRSPLLTADVHPYAIASALMDPTAISHWSALAHHGLTTQIPLTIQATTTRKVVTPEMRSGQAYSPRGRPVWRVLDLEVEFIQVQSLHFFGFQQEWMDRWHRVTITDVERTFLDMIAHPQIFGSLRVGIETLENHLDRVDLERFVEYTLRYGVKAVIKRVGWSLESLGVSEAVLAPLAAYPMQTYALLDLTGQPQGRAVARWKLYDNLV